MSKRLKFFIVFTLLSLFIFSSCEEIDDPNENDVRESYLGTWSCHEVSGLNYNVTVQLDPSNSAQILIYNFHFQGSNEKVYCIATANNLTLPSQTYCGNTVNGSGNLVNSNKFTMLYYVNDNADVETVEATYTK